MKFLKQGALGVVMACTLAYALPAHAIPLDLSTAIQTGLSANLQLKEQREKLEQNRFKYSVARSSLFPTISATSSATYRKDAVANKTVGSVPFGGDPYNLYAGGLHLDQTLFQWGSLSALRKADLEENVVEADLKIAERDLVRQIIKAFYKLSVQQNLIEILLNEQKVVGESLSTAQARMRIGGRKIDVLQVKVQMALLQPKIAEARINLASSAAELAALLGVTEGGNFELKGRLPSLENKLVESKINLKDFHLPELDRLQLNRDELDQDRSVSLGKHLPNLSLNADYGFLNYTKSDLFDPASAAWSVQLLLKVPLFSGFSSIYERRAINSEETQVDLEERAVRIKLSVDQVKSKKALEAAEQSLASAEEAAKLSQESMVEAGRNYKYGLIDFLQFLQIQRSNFEAASSLNDLKYSKIAAFTDYFVASGQPLETLVNLLAREDKK